MESSSNRSPELLEVQDLCFTYPHSGGNKGVQDISFKISRGEIVSFVGPSGCGKTTLLRLLAGFLFPREGEISYKGLPIKDFLKARKIGYTNQIPCLLPHRTVEENIMLPLEIHPSFQKRNIKEKCTNILTAFNILQYKNYYPHQLSGGTSQKVSLATAVVYEPELLFLDEPFSSIDEFTRERLDQDLVEVSRMSEYTTFLVTHSLEEAAFVSDRIFILSGSPATIVGEMKIKFSCSRNLALKQRVEFFETVNSLKKIIERNEQKK